MEWFLVIVILGILFALALPKLADLGGDARRATLNGALGAVKSAAAISHSAWLANGTSPASLTLEGTAVAFSTEGYPTATTGGIGGAAQITTDYTIGTAAAGVVRIDVTSATTPATCSFTYNQATAATSTPSTAGC